MDWIARLKNKKTSICTGIDPTEPTKYDFNRVRNEKSKDTHEGEPYKTYKNKTERMRSFPVSIKMKSAILGATADVILEPDKATVDGVEYSKPELTDLLSRKLPPEDLLMIHQVKQEFEGKVNP